MMTKDSVESTDADGSMRRPEVENTAEELADVVRATRREGPD